MLVAHETTFLLGAGASVATGLPTAYSLIDELVDNLIKKEWAREEIKRLARNNRTDMRDECDFIRFEMLISWIEDIYRDNYFFEFLENYTHPSALQKSIAEFACEGATILTPNFDDLLELAFIKNRVSPTTIDINHFNGFTGAFNRGDVIKLHGSWKYHRDNNIIRGTRPMHATIDVIIRESPGNMLNESAKRILKQSIDHQILIVVGYSASDALDIVPALHECNPRKVYWINYKNEFPIEYSIDDYLSRFSRGVELSTWEKLLYIWNRKGAETNIIVGRAEDALMSIGIDVLAATHPFDDTSWKRTIKKWANKVRHHDPTGMGLAGLLFAELCLNDLAEEAMKVSIGHRNSNCGWSSAKRLYEIAQNEFFRENADLDFVLKLTQKAKYNARKISDVKTLEYSLLLEGRCYFIKQEWDKAILTFQSSEFKRSSATYKGFCKSWIGRSYLWTRKFKKALRFLPTACNALQKSGDIDGLIDAEFAMGVCKSHLGYLIESKTILKRNDNYCRLHGLLGQRIGALTELSRINSMIGDIVDAANGIGTAMALISSVPYDEPTTTLAACADICILKNHYFDALDKIDEAISSINKFTLSQKAELLAKKAFCQIITSCDYTCTFFDFSALSRKETDYYGHIIIKLVKLKVNEINKTEFDSHLQFSKLHATEKIELAILCSRLLISSYKIRILQKNALNILHTEGIDFWNTELSV